MLLSARLCSQRNKLNHYLCVKTWFGAFSFSLEPNSGILFSCFVHERHCKISFRPDNIYIIFNILSWISSETKKSNCNYIQSFILRDKWILGLKMLWVFFLHHAIPLWHKHAEEAVLNSTLAMIYHLISVFGTQKASWRHCAEVLK